MGSKRNNFVDCVGAVTVVTIDRIVFQGQFVKAHNDGRKSEHYQPQINVENANEFVLLELTCDAAIIRENGNIETTNPPLYEDGDLVRLNVANIASVGPSGGCVEKGKDE